MTFVLEFSVTTGFQIPRLMTVVFNGKLLTKKGGKFMASMLFPCYAPKSCCAHVHSVTSWTLHLILHLFKYVLTIKISMI